MMMGNMEMFPSFFFEMRELQMAPYDGGRKAHLLKAPM